MGGEIDDEQPPARPQRARRLANGAQGIIEIMQNLMHDDEIIEVELHRQGVKIALSQLRIAQAAAFESGPGDAEHLRRLIDADRARRSRRQDFQHAAGAGAKIKHSVQRRGADGLKHRGLDALFGQVHGAHFIPIGRLRGEIASRLTSARASRTSASRARSARR